MRVLLKPLFNADLPSEFEEIIKTKLLGRELRTNEEIEINILGKTLRFRVVLAEPSSLKVERNTRIELVRGELDVVTIEFEDEVEDLVPFDKGFAVVLPGKVVVLDGRGQKLYSAEFDDLKGIRVTKDSVVVIHGRKITIIRP